MISKKSRIALDWLNFSLADVKDGLGPFLAIYLLTQQHWSAANIGLVLTVMAVAGLIAQTPMGAYVDKTNHKRTLLAISAIVVILSTLVIIWYPTFYSILTAKIFMGVAACAFGPLIAAITLGLAGHKVFAAQVGRNEAFNHGGNVFAAILAGAIGYYYSSGSVFYMVVIMAVMSIFLVMIIRKNEINNDIARGFDEDDLKQNHQPASFFSLFKNKTLVLFILAIMLFHFANAAMLPLIGQKLSLNNARESMLLMSACIIVAQLTMIPMAMIVGKKANKWGRKPIFLLAFLVLPIRGVVFAYINNPVILVLAQVLDGIGAGIFGALFLIVLADITEGTGRFNISQGLATTTIGIGAALSTLLAGIIVDQYNYSIAFYFLAAVAVVALIIFVLFVPETKRKENL